MSPRPTRLFLVASLFVLSPVWAEEAKSGSSETVVPYQLQKKSTFAPLGEDSRAPFWPIGWVKRKVGQPGQSMAAVSAAPKVTLDAQNFKVTSILLGAPSFAIINGRTYSEGEFLRTPRTAPAVVGSPASTAPRIRVFRITDGSVVLQYEAQLITLTLQRPELAAKRADEEQLLNEDRP